MPRTLLPGESAMFPDVIITTTTLTGLAMGGFGAKGILIELTSNTSRGEHRPVNGPY